MNRLVRGSVILAAAAVSWACGGLDTDGIDTTAQLVADPGVVYVANTDSQAVFVEALNDLGQQLEGDFTVTNVGPGINVNYDSAFAPRPGVEDLPTRVRYFVRASDPTTFVNSSFTVTANGVSVTIPVRVTPAELSVLFSNSTPAPGDTVTLVAPANLRFIPGTTVTVAGGTAQVISVSADSTTLQVVFSTGIFDVAPVIEGVVIAYLPDQVFDIPTLGTITTSSLSDFPVVLSDNAPNYGDPVTLTISDPFRITSASTVTAPGAATAINSVAADSLSLVFQAGPNASGVVSIDNLIISGAEDLGFFTLTIDTTTTFTTPALTSFPAVFSTATPAGGSPLTMTAPAGFKFLPTVTVTVGGVNTLIESVSADSSVVTFVPQPGTSGVPVVTNVVISTLVGLPLTLPATTSLTVGASQFNNVDDPSLADFLTIPTPGNTITIYDGGPYFTGTFAGNGADSRYYRVSLAAARTVDVVVEWDNVSDMGLYVIDAGFTAILDGADSFGNQNGGPETATFDLAAGDYIFAMVKFGTGANVYKFTFTTQ